MNRWWLVAVYNPGDVSLTGPIWSIEICRLWHVGARVGGTLWRLYTRELRGYGRRWHVSGRVEESVFRASYWATRDKNGGYGALSLWEAGASDGGAAPCERYVGTLHCAVAATSAEWTARCEDRPTEWVPLPASGTMDMILERIPEAAVCSYLPRAGRERLWRDMEPYQENLALAAATVELRFALEVRRLSRARELRSAPENRAALFRSDLPLGQVM